MQRRGIRIRSNHRTAVREEERCDGETRVGGGRGDDGGFVVEEMGVGHVVVRGEDCLFRALVVDVDWAEASCV